MIVINDESILRAKCSDVLSDEVKSLVATLEKELALSALLGKPGIGLAAPQINIHKKAAIVRIDSKYKVDLINARIKKTYDPFIFENEGCLSFPDLLKNTKRFNEIHVTNNLVYPYSFIATGLFAIAIQHELDHLDGKLLIDRK